MYAFKPVARRTKVLNNSDLWQAIKRIIQILTLISLPLAIIVSCITIFQHFAGSGQSFSGNGTNPAAQISGITPTATSVGIAPTATPTNTPTPTPTATPIPPTPTPKITLNVPSLYAGMYDQADGSSYDVLLAITKKNADGSFDGKWYVTVYGSEEDLIVQGVIASFSQSGQLSQIDQTELQPVQQINQNDGGNDLLLWFKSIRRDVGQDILLGYVYYGAIEQGGHVQGVSYLAGSSEQAATFQLDPQS